MTHRLLAQLLSAALAPAARQLGQQIVATMLPMATAGIRQCDACGRCRPIRECRAHKRQVCGRCICPTCAEIKARIKAGKPRTPASEAHDPATCNCPWCCKWDGPEANNPNVGMGGTP